MNRGDRVTVIVMGERVPATVLDPLSPAGSVQVRLDVSIPVEPLLSVRDVYRHRSNVEPIVRPDPSRAYEIDPWPSGRATTVLYVVTALVVLFVIFEPWILR